MSTLFSCANHFRQHAVTGVVASFDTWKEVAPEDCYDCAEERAATVWDEPQPLPRIPTAADLARTPMIVKVVMLRMEADLQRLEAALLAANQALEVIAKCEVPRTSDQIDESNSGDWRDIGFEQGCWYAAEIARTALKANAPAAPASVTKDEPLSEACFTGDCGRDDCDEVCDYARAQNPHTP